MARYKAIPSKKEEFDAFWDDLMTKCGCNKEQKAEIIRQSAEFMAKSHELGEKLEIYAKAGRKEGESLEDFKNRKLKALDIQADAINRLSE